MPNLFHDLPVTEALPALKTALSNGANAVLVAPPGAGKTTCVPLALLAEAWAKNAKLLVLVPRRLAARGAAARIAGLLGEPVGRTVGYRVRFDSKVSADTRIELITEGVFTRMISADPALDGVAAVLFDEFHERSLDADLGLALALETQEALRPDLRLLIMSATLDPGPVADLLGGAPRIESKGRAFPVEIRHADRDARQALVPQIADMALKALGESAGSVLAFVPGRADVERACALISERVGGRPDVTVAGLHGGVEPAEQNAILLPPASGARRIVVATSIAESSLTIPDVRAVVDSGLARRPAYEPSTGLTRLKTVRVSRASAAQRSGRAGRTAPGVCYRMWPEAQSGALPERDRPEILDSDLAPLTLTLAAMGVRDPAGLRWLDAPSAPALAEAANLLRSLGLISADGAVTEAGRAAAALPLHPRLAHMIIAARAWGEEKRAAEIAAVLSEPGLGGDAIDLAARLDRFRGAGGPRAKAARAQAKRWAAVSGGNGAAATLPAGNVVGRLLALAYPDRIGQKRGRRGAFRLANGRGAEIDPSDRLSNAEMIVAAEISGGGADGRVRLAAEISLEDVRAGAPGLIEVRRVVSLDANGKTVRASEEQRYGALVLRRTLVPLASGEAEAALAEHVRRRGPESLPWSAAARSLRRRLDFLHRHIGAPWPDMCDEALLAGLDDWFVPYLAGITSLADLRPAQLETALRGIVPHELAADIDRLAPRHYVAPSGLSHEIDYADEKGPTVRAKMQEFYGLQQHPTVLAGRVPLVLELRSPADRPIQTTTDIAGFWGGSWADARRDMRGRYPKHNWPDDPASAQASRRTTKSKSPKS